MSKKVTLPKYEQMILDIALMNVQELEQVIRCAKVTLAIRHPKAPRKKRTPQIPQEKAS